MNQAIYRYLTAKGYFQSVVMIARSPRRDTEEARVSTIPPMSMLAGFALELYFKAWLLRVQSRHLVDRIEDEAVRF